MFYTLEILETRRPNTRLGDFEGDQYVCRVTPEWRGTSRVIVRWCAEIGIGWSTMVDPIDTYGTTVSGHRPAFFDGRLTVAEAAAHLSALEGR